MFFRLELIQEWFIVYIGRADSGIYNTIVVFYHYLEHSPRDSAWMLELLIVYS